MLTPSNELQNPCGNVVPLLYDHSIGDPYDEVAGSYELEVAAPILFECSSCMEPGTVEFEHEPLADEDVDAADTIDPDLRAVSNTPTEQQHPHERLESGLRAAVGPIELTQASAGDLPPHPLHLRRPEPCPVQRGLERHHGGANITAPEHLGDSAFYAVVRSRTRWVRRVMNADRVARGIKRDGAIIGRGKAARASRHPNMQQRIVERPKSVEPGSRSRRESPTDADRPHDPWWRIGRREPSLSDAVEMTGTDSGEDVRARDRGGIRRFEVDRATVRTGETKQVIH